MGGAWGFYIQGKRTVDMLDQELSTMVGSPTQIVNSHMALGTVPNVHETMLRLTQREAQHSARPYIIYPGWTGATAAMRRTLGDERNDPMPYTHKWDRALCCGLQIKFVSLILCVVFFAGAVVSFFGDSYTYMQLMFDWRFGFALQEGYPYTAPVSKELLDLGAPMGNLSVSNQDPNGRKRHSACLTVTIERCGIL